MTNGRQDVCMKVNGVNLGNWLVLEKWMNPSLFEGTTAEDEYYLPAQLSKEVYEARIRTHRREYINERDFVIMKSWGITTIRIPVPYFIFGDREPFIGCIEDLDRAFAWSERYDLQILIDLHTAPLSQNGFDNGGICGVCKWAVTPDEVEFVLTVLERLSQRYGNRKGLWGIEVINEPISEDMWDRMNIQERYVPVEPELAAGSKGIPLDFLRKFYTEAYERMRKYLLDDKYIVIHDAFELLHWKDFMQEDHYQNVVLDTHQYLMMAELMGCEQTVSAYSEFVNENFKAQIEEMSNYFPVICGEWCLFNSLATGRDTKGGQTVLNGVEGTSQEAYSDEQKKEIYLELAKVQLEAWNSGSGHFYWSYKIMIDTVNDDGWIGWDSWDLGRCIGFGWYPVGGREEIFGL